MKTSIVILLGERSSGKSMTIRKLFKIKGKRRKGCIKKGKKIIYFYKHGSPQENEAFCHVNVVNDNIDDRINKCEIWHKKLGYNHRPMTVVIPFTIKREKKKLNTDCILKPIKRLKWKGYKVKVVYLEKRDKELEKLVKATKPRNSILSYNGEERRQARELFRIL